MIILMGLSRVGSSPTPLTFLLGYFWRITLLERAFWRWRLAREGFVVFFGRGHGTTLLLTWRNGFWSVCRLRERYKSILEISIYSAKFDFHFVYNARSLCIAK